MTCVIGEVLEWICYVKRKILNAILARMVNQCSCFSVGVMWSLGLRSFVRFAVVRRTEDRVVVSMREIGQDIVAVVESRDDESLKKKRRHICPDNVELVEH